MIGASSHGPVSAPTAIAPPPLNRYERALLFVANVLAWAIARAIDASDALRVRAMRRSDAAAREQIYVAMGPPSKVP